MNCLPIQVLTRVNGNCDIVVASNRTTGQGGYWDGEENLRRKNIFIWGFEILHQTWVYGDMISLQQNTVESHIDLFVYWTFI